MQTVNNEEVRQMFKPGVGAVVLFTHAPNCNYLTGKSKCTCCPNVERFTADAYKAKIKNEESQ